ncbi:PDZK1-interacting protein 1 [Sparus aurata]|uniref:PDZK1 interacting protein 1 n=1 Tax=Sparus aurata TaxID=8175 RepID=A0A671VJT4_SPAAU|nr:PDZK1-interacting protein 1-like [Sparus aurata]
MEKLSAVISCLLLTVAAVTAQAGQSKASERPLPQWLTGIIAVSGFLFLAFVSILVKKAWCDSSREKVSVDSEKQNEFIMTNGNTYDTQLSAVRSQEYRNAYDNLVIDSTDDKVTAM